MAFMGILAWLTFGALGVHDTIENEKFKEMTRKSSIETKSLMYLYFLGWFCK